MQWNSEMKARDLPGLQFIGKGANKYPFEAKHPSHLDLPVAIEWQCT